MDNKLAIKLTLKAVEALLSATSILYDVSIKGDDTSEVDEEIRTLEAVAASLKAGKWPENTQTVA